jgi:hypothetical protein
LREILLPKIIIQKAQAAAAESSKQIERGITLPFVISGRQVHGDAPDYWIAEWVAFK